LAGLINRFNIVLAQRAKGYVLVSESGLTNRPIDHEVLA
jgi:hypothetical protein